MKGRPVTIQSPASQLSHTAIAFDLDGTLVDTAPDLVAALNATLRQDGLSGFAVETMRPMVGQGARALLQRAAHAHGVDFDAPRLDALTEQFIAHYRDAIAVESRPFPGCIAVLEALSQAGVTISVCTNKRTGLAQALLSALHMDHYFKAIVGSDSVAARKPHPDHFWAAIDQAGGDRAHSIMIGDSEADVGAAIAAGRPVVMVGFGYLDQPAKAYGATAIIDHFDELIATCATLLAPAAR
jgi:phosphoglycolate phosphatase